MSISKSMTNHIKSPAYRLCVLGLFFMLFSIQSFAAPKHRTKKKSIEDTMTVAAIRIPNSSETFVRVTFVRSQRFYKLPNDANPNYLDLLKASEKNHAPVIIKRKDVASDIILGVRKP